MAMIGNDIVDAKMIILIQSLNISYISRTNCYAAADAGPTAQTV
jgi:hypothetical protein